MGAFEEDKGGKSFTCRSSNKPTKIQKSPTLNLNVFLVSNNWRGCEGRAKEGKKCDGDSRSSKKIWNQFVGRLLGEKRAELGKD